MRITGIQKWLMHRQRRRRRLIECILPLARAALNGMVSQKEMKKWMSNPNQRRTLGFGNLQYSKHFGFSRCVDKVGTHCPRLVHCPLPRVLPLGCCGSHMWVARRISTLTFCRAMRLLSRSCWIRKTKAMSTLLMFFFANLGLFHSQCFGY